MSLWFKGKAVSALSSSEDLLSECLLVCNSCRSHVLVTDVPQGWLQVDHKHTWKVTDWSNRRGQVSVGLSHRTHADYKTASTFCKHNLQLFVYVGILLLISPPLTWNSKQSGGSQGASFSRTTSKEMLLLLQQRHALLKQADTLRSCCHKNTHTDSLTRWFVTSANLPIKGQTASAEGSDWLAVERRSVWLP